MKKYLVIPAVLCLAASLLTACGGGKSETSAANTKAEQGQTTAAEKETTKTADGGSDQITLRFS